MFAVLKTGGKQYKVQSGDTLRVEKLAANAGDKVQFNEILMLGGDTTVIGTPFVDGAAVQAEVIDQVKGAKLIHFVKRRRKHSSQRKKGHRQQLTLLKITDILGEGGDKTGVKAALGAGSAPAALLQPAAKAEPKAAPKAEKKAKKDDGKAKEAKSDKKAKKDKTSDAAKSTRPDNLLDEARGGKADDLKLISGVGPKLEKLLNKNGVFHFDQIAAWSGAEIAYMDDQLSFKGRIERDNWIKQASKLAAKQE